MRYATAFFLLTVLLTGVASPLAAQQTVVYSQTRYIQGADDTLGYSVELRLEPGGRVTGGELRIYEGPPEPTVRISLEVRLGGRRLLLQGRHEERGLFTLAGTRTDDAIRGTVKEAEHPPVSVHLRREPN